MRKIFFVVICAFLLSSCMTTHNYVGKYQEMTDFGRTNDTLYDKTKQCYVIGGLVPLGQKRVKTPQTNCDVKTQMTFIDGLVSGCTGGFFTMQTIKVLKVVDPNLRPEHIEKRIPLIESGWEFEGGYGIPYMVDLSGMYKMNNYLSLGLTYATSYPNAYFDGWVSAKDETVEKIEMLTFDATTTFKRFQHKWALKGNYRILNKMLSPFVSLEVGVHHRELEEQNDGECYKKKMGLGFSYAVGVSYRFINSKNPNNYLSLKFGNEKIFGKWDYYSSEYNAISKKVKLTNAHNLYLMLSYTRTLNRKWSKLEGKGANWKLPIGD